jgi:hypothetical protein
MSHFVVSFLKGVDPLAFNFITLMDRLFLAFHSDNRSTTFTNTTTIVCFFE